MHSFICETGKMKKSIGIGIIETEIVAIFLSRDKTRNVNFTKNIVNKLEIFARRAINRCIEHENNREHG